MFDKLITNHVKGPDSLRVQIDMPRPDTAEFARLANDMRREAEKDVARATVRRFGCNNYVKVVECATDWNPAKGTDMYRARVKFTVNDELYDTELFDLESGMAVDSRHALEQAIIDQLMAQLLRTLRQKL